MTKRDQEPLCECVRRSLESYFVNLDGEEPAGVYHMVLNEVERPLLEIVMREAHANQTRAARILGVNRNTLRKKLRMHGLE
jgi:Fis family transcriptional regulator